MKKAIVVGSGIGGLTSAILLRHAGHAVTVFEAADGPGGKLREKSIGQYRFDLGPSLFTMPLWVDQIYQLVGKDPRDYYQYEALDTVCRYFYKDGMRFSAYSDTNRYLAELESKLKLNAKTVQSLKKAMKRNKRIYDITAHLFLEKSLHRWQTYANWATLKSVLQLPFIDSLRSMHQANTQDIKEPYLVQFFDRYATYNGSNPYRAPATLNLIPHLEHHYGAWFPKGGMFQITNGLYQLALDLGVEFKFECTIEQILTEEKKVLGVKTKEDSFEADIVVSNMDIDPTYRKLLPQYPAPEKVLAQEKSSSALIFYWGIKRPFPELDMHNIFFSEAYEAEFKAIGMEKTLYEDPTVYINITSKANPSDAPEGCENWFVMINAPHDVGQKWEELINVSRTRIQNKLSRLLGQDIASLIEVEEVLSPPLIRERTSSFGGALYGTASNNKMAAFFRHPNFHSKIKGLYFCGGSVHPGGGIPLALRSGKIAAELAIAEAKK